MGETEAGSDRIVVCDAGPLIHLDEVGCLDLLADFSAILLPASVWEEVATHRPAALSCRGIELRCVTPVAPPPVELQALSKIFNLHRGEQDALQVALGEAGARFLTDDTAARLAASNLGIQARGTLGIIIRAIRRRQRSKQEVLTILRAMPTHSSLHLKRSFLDAVIQDVEDRA